MQRGPVVKAGPLAQGWKGPEARQAVARGAIGAASTSSTSGGTSTLLGCFFCACMGFRVSLFCISPWDNVFAFVRYLLAGFKMFRGFCFTCYFCFHAMSFVPGGCRLTHFARTLTLLIEFLALSCFRCFRPLFHWLCVRWFQIHFRQTICRTLGAENWARFGRGLQLPPASRVGSTGPKLNLTWVVLLQDCLCLNVAAEALAL